MKKEWSEKNDRKAYRKKTARTRAVACDDRGYGTYDEIAAAGHNYGAPTWNWNGTESAQAQFVCENNDDTQTVNATITSEVTTEPSYTTEGVRTYTATVTFNGTPYTDTKTETINALTPPLENLSQVSSETITAGSKLTLTGAAQGGEGAYTYSYYYKKSTTNNWTTKLENTTKTTASITPGKPVPYDVKIVVTDEAGNTQEKTFTVEVQPLPLVNKSTVPESIKAGETLTLTGAAEGGAAPYTYSYYYKKSTTDNWTTKRENTKLTSISIKPGTAVLYDVRIVVTDKAGNTAEQTFTVDVTE